MKKFTLNLLFKSTVIMLCLGITTSIVAQTFNTGTTGAIPDNNCDVTNEFTMDLTGSGLGTLNQVTFGFETLCFDITHSWCSDVDITLFSPDGTAVEISTDNGGSSNNYTGTCVNKNGVDGPITAGTAPFTGTYVPEGNLADFNNGQDPNGVWTLRVCDDASGDTGTLNSWDITFGSSPAANPSPPVNDECAAALVVVPNINLTCTTTTPGTIEFATGSGISDGTCDGTEDDDVWFFFVATATTHTINLINIVNGTTYLNHSVWSGTCGSLVNLNCSQLNTSTLTGLTIGATYYLRVYSWTATSGQTTDFDVCITTFVPPPANNDCAGAVSYDTTFGPIGANGTCPANTDMLDISAYTNAGVDPTCDFGGDATAWYTWTANATSVDFTSGTGAPGIEILSGSCGSLTSLGCLNNSSGTIGGLTIGVSYHIIIWDDDLSGTTLEWCLEETLGPPPNDACGNAIAIGSGGNKTGSTTLASNIESLTPCANGGGGSVDCPAPGGTGTIDFGAGVWFVYTSDILNETIEVSTDNPGTNFDTEIQVFEGSCGALTCIGGDDDGGSVNLSTSSVFCWLSSGTPTFAPVNYYIYVDGHGTSTGNFELTLSTTNSPLPVTLSSFKGEVMERTNMLKWITASEENTEFHVIERSVDGAKDWGEVGRINAAGFSNQPLEYSMEDVNPLLVGYYRLKSIDFDGYEDISNILLLKRTINDEVVYVYPSPAKETLNVEFGVMNSGHYDLKIMNAMGQVMSSNAYQFEEGMQLLEININQLSSGIYYLILENNFGQKVKKFVKD